MGPISNKISSLSQIMKKQSQESSKDFISSLITKKRETEHTSDMEGTNASKINIAKDLLDSLLEQMKNDNKNENYEAFEAPTADIENALSKAGNNTDSLIEELKRLIEQRASSVSSEEEPAAEEENPASKITDAIKLTRSLPNSLVNQAVEELTKRSSGEE